MHLSLSIITPTRNRAFYLDKHFRSLLHQLSKSDEIILIDNDSTDTTQEIVNKYRNKLPIRYYRMPSGASYGALYNFGILKSTKDILVFFDDDCIAGARFIDSIKKAHEKNKDTLIQGNTYSLPDKNIYAEIMGNHYKNWIKSNTLPDGVHMKTFDNKNASIPKKKLKRIGLFDETLRYGSEDIELGFRLRQEGVSILFEPTIVAYHYERDTFPRFIQQHIRIARSEAFLNRTEDNSKRIGPFPKRIIYHIETLHLLEWDILKQRRYKDAILHPVLLLFLVFCRIYGYSKQTAD